MRSALSDNCDRKNCDRKTGSWAALHWPAAAVIASFAVFAAWSVPQGLGSLDAHGVVATVNQLVERHLVGVSRPPGHPTTEFYFLGSIAWLLRFFTGRVFGATAFLVLQGLTAVAVAIVFYQWLLRIGISPLRATLGLCCLLGSPQFLKQAVDGEEFLAALLLLLLAVRVLSPCGSDTRAWRINVSVALFALATGCRPEFALFGLLYYFAFARYHGLSAARALAALGMALLALLIVWAPVFATVGIVPPYGDGVDARHRFAIWGYKLLFQAFGFPVSLLLLGVLVATLLGFRTRMGAAVFGFHDAMAPWIALLFCLAFWAYPTKPAFLLVALPFLLVLALRTNNTVCLLLAAMTAIGCCVGIDIVRDRRISPPCFVPGALEQALADKPSRRGDYLAALAAQSHRQTVVIGDLWSWDYEYAIGHMGFSAKPDARNFAQGAFVAISDDTRLFLPKEYLSNQALLQSLRDHGFVFVMDRLLWRMIYARYELMPKAMDVVSVGDVPVHLIDVSVHG